LSGSDDGFGVVVDEGYCILDGGGEDIKDNILNDSEFMAVEFEMGEFKRDWEGGCVIGKVAFFFVIDYF
jgi:hypothetical protein